MPADPKAEAREAAERIIMHLRRTWAGGAKAALCFEEDNSFVEAEVKAQRTAVWREAEQIARMAGEGWMSADPKRACAEIASCFAARAKEEGGE